MYNISTRYLLNDGINIVGRSVRLFWTMEKNIIQTRCLDYINNVYLEIEWFPEILVDGKKSRQTTVLLVSLLTTVIV